MPSYLPIFISISILQILAWHPFQSFLLLYNNFPSMPSWISTFYLCLHLSHQAYYLLSVKDRTTPCCPNSYLSCTPHPGSPSSQPSLECIQTRLSQAFFFLVTCTQWCLPPQECRLKGKDFIFHSHSAQHSENVYSKPVHS